MGQWGMDSHDLDAITRTTAAADEGPAVPAPRSAPDADEGGRRAQLADIKAEITKLIEARFIRQCRYAEWISNVVPVYKKNGKLRVCIDFRNLNKATPMDGYPMPVADLLVDAAAGHRIISFKMAMQGTIKYSWPRKIFPKPHLDVLVMLGCLIG
jgi:hypothetical protein